MLKREVVKLAMDAKPVPYVPWRCGFTQEIAVQLRLYYKTDDIDQALANHIINVGNTVGQTDLGNNHFRDVFGVVWNRTVEKDVGVIDEYQLKGPTIKGYNFPNPLDKRCFNDIPAAIEKYSDCFRVFPIGFSLYERAWTLRGMENLMMDFIENPNFVKTLLRAIADYNIAQIKEAMKFDIDAVQFGDDWGQQTGLQMGPALWREFIKPELTRMYAEVRKAGKYVMIHSCGKVDELFDDLIDIGLNCFNPFQPEVMDVFSLMRKYHGKLAFHGGLSTQKTLPYGSTADVAAETRRLLEAGKKGGYIFAPAHAVEGDVPLENILAFVEVLHEQKGFVA